MARKKKKLYVTPAGIAVWPRLWTADTKFNPAGTYSTKMNFDMNLDPVQAMVELFQNQMELAVTEATAERAEKIREAKAAKQKLVIKPVKAADTPFTIDEEDNTVQVNFKMTASGVREDKTKWTQKPNGFDAAGTPITRDLSIGGGSKLRVSYNLDRFYTVLVGAGITLRLKSYQLLQLVQFGGAGFDESGFEQVDDGGFKVSDMAEDEDNEFATPADENAEEATDEPAAEDDDPPDTDGGKSDDF